MGLLSFRWAWYRCVAGGRKTRGCLFVLGVCTLLVTYHLVLVLVRHLRQGPSAKDAAAVTHRSQFSLQAGRIRHVTRKPGQPSVGRQEDGPASTIQRTQENFQRLLEEHRTLQSNVLSGKVPLERGLIFRCSIDLERCGGVGDRFYGMVVLYIGAILTKRPFFIHSVKPAPLEEFLVPNEFDWRISSIANAKSQQRATSCAKGGSKLDKCVQHEIQIPYKKCGFLRNLLFGGDYFLNINDNYRTDCVEEFLREVSPLNSLADKTNVTQQLLREFATNVSHLLLRMLFRPSRRVVHAAMAVLGTAHSSASHAHDCLLCVHVRTGSGLGERARHTDMSMFQSCAAQAELDWRTISGSKCPSESTWLLVGDSEKALDNLQELSSAGGSRHFIRSKQLGNTSHIDDPAKNIMSVSSGMIRAYVDWYMLSRCRYIVASLSTLSATSALYFGPSMHRYDVEVATNRTNTCKHSRISDWQRDTNAV